MNLSRAQMGVSCWIKYGGKCVWCVIFSYSMQSHNAQSPLAHHPGGGRFLFSIGASLGIILGGFLGISPLLCAALGYAAVFGSATNTLMAPIMLGIEVFGGNNMLAFVVVCSLAYVINGNRSIYGAQENIEKIISR